LLRGGTAAHQRSSAATSKAVRAGTADVHKGTARVSEGNDRTARRTLVGPRLARPNQPQVEDNLRERLTAVEAQLAAAVARLEALEARMTKSLFGLRVSL
jgi:hypothetical protein